MRLRTCCALAAGSLWFAPIAAAPLTAGTARLIDQSVAESLARTRTPSASIAVVLDGTIAYAKAYGQAGRPNRAATVNARYGLGSVSKQFTAAAILLLAEEGKLSLDDKVARWFPGLSGANQVSVGQLLSHSAGYEDYFPQISVPPMIRQAATPDAIIDKWGHRPLTFSPGVERQYSNTGYVIAGRIAERVSGDMLFALMRRRIFAPLGMASAVDNDAHPIGPPDAERFTRAALGPVRPARPEGSGWMFAAGGLAMTASDLARWDISLIDRSLMRPASYDAMLRPARLANGRDSGYGLGLYVEDEGGRTLFSHDGQISGYLAINRIYPVERAAIVVLTNTESGTGFSDIADRIAFQVLAPDLFAGKVLQTLKGLQSGRIDVASLTANARAYFDRTTLGDFKTSLAPFGPVRIFKLLHDEKRAGMTHREYRVIFAKGAISLSAYLAADGKIEELVVQPLGD